MIEIIAVDHLQTDNMRLMTELAELWLEAFPGYACEPLAELRQCLQDDRLAFAALDDQCAAGFVGAIPQYGVTGWELHPLMIGKPYQGRGLGTQLLQLMEEAVRAKGGITLYLGTDDTDGLTSLAFEDLYANTFEKIRDIQTLTPERHPYEFYLKNGYTITGVTPDANGIGKPDIWMAKRL